MDETRALVVGWTIFLLALIVTAMYVAGAVGVR